MIWNQYNGYVNKMFGKIWKKNSDIYICIAGNERHTYLLSFRTLLAQENAVFSFDSNSAFTHQ